MVKLTGLEPPAEYAPPRQSLSEARERLAEFLTESVLEQVTKKRVGIYAVGKKTAR